MHNKLMPECLCNKFPRISVMLVLQNKTTTELSRCLALMVIDKKWENAILKVTLPMPLLSMLSGAAVAQGVLEGCRPVNENVTVSNDDILLSRDAGSSRILAVSASRSYVKRVSISSKCRVRPGSLYVDVLVQVVCVVNWTISVEADHITIDSFVGDIQKIAGN